jgi:hypothetical protein
VSDTRILMHAERRIGKHDCSAGTDLLKAHASRVEASVEVDEAVGAVREIADFAHDEDLAQAIIDRMLERGRLLRLDGPSVRTLHVNLDTMKEDSDQQADLVRISGNRWSEFPEPTPGNKPLNR